MAKFKGKELWNELEGVKEEIAETVEVGLGDVKGEVTVVYRDFDEVQEVFSEYEEKLPKKPNITIRTNNGKENIRVPTEDKDKKGFNNHPKAKPKIKEWKKECKPVEKERTFRIAYLYMKEDERPHDDPEKGTKILMDRLSYIDAVEIANTGTSLNNLGDRMGKQEESSLIQEINQEK